MTTPASATHPAARLLHVAWLSVLLGLGMEALLLVAAAGFGKHPVLAPVLADLVQKVSWATVVCVGLACGTAVTKLRVPAMGVAGLLAAPAGFIIARSLHKSATQALAIAAPAAAAGPSPLLLAALKGIEYAVLGFALGRIGRTQPAGLAGYLAAGLSVGAVFGGFIVWLLTRETANPPALLVVSRIVNELIFPIGCSLVLYAADAFRHRT